ncbi:MAG TPA: hypothetical protein DCQ36_01165, partial [Actinobacteria bacterium]|nr:hypothetical protein [Actinomycetota bacterium]
ATATVAWQMDRWSGRVRLPSDGALRAETGPSALSSASDPGPPADLSSDRTPLPALVAAVVIALATLAVGVAVGAAARSRGRRQRIQQVLDYSSSPGVERTVTRNSRVPRGARPSGTDSRVEQMLSGLSSELAAGAVSLSPAAWLGIQALIAVALIIVSVLVWGTVWLGLLALIGVPAVFTLSLRMRVERRQRAFADELPDFLLLLASALRAGLSFTQALESSADQNHGEVGRQIRRALAEAQVGSDLDSALMACAVRMGNEDLRWTVTALGLQREVGGNLSSILDGAAATIRDRHALGREVRTLSAEGRLSAYVLMALPVGVFLFLLLFRREYVSQLWSSPLGIAMMVALVVLMLLGWVWMRAIVRIRV